MTNLGDLVFTACDNAIANGYPLDPDDRQEAQDIIDTDADVANLLEELYPRLWDDDTVLDAAIDRVAGLVKEYRARGG